MPKPVMGIPISGKEHTHEGMGAIAISAVTLLILIAGGVFFFGHLDEQVQRVDKRVERMEPSSMTYGKRSPLSRAGSPARLPLPGRGVVVSRGYARLRLRLSGTGRDAARGPRPTSPAY